MKYSIIVPIYNAEKYILKCINSILNQNYDGNYEVIIINDGSTDKSKDIITSINNKKIKYFEIKNSGVSYARNYGVSKVTGEYFLFVDADDYIANNLLSTVDKNIQKKIDILSYNIIDVNSIETKITKPCFNEKTGEQAIVEFINSSTMFDTPVGYVYNTKYFKTNNFKYAQNKVHEDFGLTPIVILKAKIVKSIEDYLYYYVRNTTGITGKTNNLKKAEDMLYHFDNLYNIVNKDNSIDNKTKKIFNSFIASAIINKAKTLNRKDKNKYIKEIKKRNATSLLLQNNILRLIKKIVIKINIKLYLKLF